MRGWSETAVWFAPPKDYAVEKAANGGWCITAGAAVPAAMEFISAQAWSVLQIEGPPVTKVEDALLIPAFKRVWRLPRQADVCGGVHPLPRAVCGDIGECPFQPDIYLVACMAVIWDGLGRCSQENLATALREIAP